MNRSTRLVCFLQDDLGISSEAMAIAYQRADVSLAPLHVILWQLGLISIQELERAFDWLETQSA